MNQAHKEAKQRNRAKRRAAKLDKAQVAKINAPIKAAVAAERPHGSVLAAAVLSCIIALTTS